MRLEYFQLIDRIVELKLADRKISGEATVPTASTIFEGHFPGYPLMPGVLLIEAMAQTSGWLVVALNRFQRMPFLAAVKDAKLRTFVKPGERLTVDAHLEHDGSGYAVTEADDQKRRQAHLRRHADAARARFPQRRNEQRDPRIGRRASD